MSVLIAIAGVWLVIATMLIAILEYERRRPLTAWDEYCSRVDADLDAERAGPGWRT
jgi:hypothetical protein